MTRRGAGGNNGQGSSWIRPEKRRRIYLRDGYACVYCGGTPAELTLDHVQPRGLGGSNESSSCAVISTSLSWLMESGFITFPLFGSSGIPPRPAYLGTYPVLSRPRYSPDEGLLPRIHQLRSQSRKIAAVIADFADFRAPANLFPFTLEQLTPTRDATILCGTITDAIL